MTAGPPPPPRASAPRSWLIDMDGVLVHEDVIPPGADRFLGRVRERGAPFLVAVSGGPSCVLRGSGDGGSPPRG